MSPPPFNPYAPPQVTPFASPYARHAPGPLPEGVRRFRLDPASYRELATALLRRKALLLVLLFVAPTAIFAALEGVGGMVALVIVSLIFGYTILKQWLRVRNPNSSEVLTYELLVSPRVLRRALAGAATAEVLRPEVTAILDTPDGLWVSCQSPARSIFIVRTLDGYADVRAILETWGKFDPIRGWAARRRGIQESKRQGPRDVIMGTALAVDPSLSQELESVRGASVAPWLSYPAAPAAKSPAWRGLLLWVVLIAMFLAIWQFLSPTEHPQSPRHPRPAASP